MREIKKSAFLYNLKLFIFNVPTVFANAIKMNNVRTCHYHQPLLHTSVPSFHCLKIVNLYLSLIASLSSSQPVTLHTRYMMDIKVSH